MGRGVYKLSDKTPGVDPQIIRLGLKHKNAVLCLISALFIHKLTTQIPRRIYVALPKGSHPPEKVKNKVEFFTISPEQYELGIEQHEIDGWKFKVYDPEKTIVDCFKFRNKMGIDLAIESLKEWKKKRPKNLKKLLAYAKACRMEKVMAPYLEAIA
jgi:predicted transcriptional regulator of viral defense system